MRQTSNLALQLPDLTDYVNIEDINVNMEKIDTEIAKINDPSTGVGAQLTKHLAENATKTQKGHTQVGTNIDVTAGVISVKDATTTQKGVTQLNDTVTSTSTTQAATPRAVKQVMDKATEALETAINIPVTQINSGTWSDTTTSIPKLSNYTKTIPLPFAAKKGRLMLKSTSLDNASAIIHFTNINNDSIGISFRNSGGIDVKSYSTKDGRLTDGIFAGQNIWVLSCHINNQNLVIDFYNSSGSAQKMSLDFCLWEVEG